MTKLRKQASVIALAGLLALFGTACASDDDTADTEDGAAEETSEAVEEAAS